MTTFKKILFALPALALSTSALARDISGNYLITVTKGRPHGVTGATLCATVVQQAGTTVGFAASGTVTIQGFQGNWFSVGDTKGATFEIPLDSASASFITFSGVFGAPQIAGTSFIEVINGQPVVAGSFSAVKGGC